MLIRPAHDGDFPAIAAITNHYILTTTIHFGYEAVDANDLCEAWRASRERYPFLVAEEGGVVVGYAKAGTWRERAAYAWTTELGLYVAHDTRGRGIGKALYAELLAELVRRGFRSAVAGITMPNDPSVKLHEAFGFTYVGRFADAGYKNGGWHDVAWWQKRLSQRDGEPGQLAASTK
jgi:phosphinothricin acetyltransferase